MINTNRDFNKYLTISILLVLGIFILIYFWPYINGFFGAFILFALFLPLYKIFINKFKINKNLSAILIIIITVLIVLVPSYFIISRSYTEIVNFVDRKDIIIDQIESFEEKFPMLNISEKIEEFIPNITDWTISVIFSNFNNVMKILVTLLIMYFLLFYLLVYNKELYKILKEFLPFNDKNSSILAKEFKRITYATLITTGLVAIFQGLLLSLGFWFFNIKGAVIWGVVAAILSFLPVLGVPLIWIPFAFVYFLRNDLFVAIGLIVLGLIINYSEYFMRPYFQRKIGDLHPLVSIIGIFIGISAFGFVGIVIGPLMLSYFMLTFKMFKEEYLVSNKDSKK
jgi:predicted PurR-regulated permease PerM